jgi:SAM-dependent methyltransferase
MPSFLKYRLMEGEKYPVEDGSVDLVTAFMAAHWFDLPAFFKEVRRILAPGGVVALACYQLSRLELPWSPEKTEAVFQSYIEVP